MDKYGRFSLFDIACVNCIIKLFELHFTSYFPQFDFIEKYSTIICNTSHEDIIYNDSKIYNYLRHASKTFRLTMDDCTIFLKQKCSCYIGAYFTRYILI